MNSKELQTIAENGESSTVEFKSDNVKPEQLAKEMGALLNGQGGRIFLGIEDNGEISGMVQTAEKAEERIMSICDNLVDPSIIPHWETVSIDGKKVGIITLPSNAPDTPYKVKQGGKWITFIRMGTTSREASREQEGRLYAKSRLTGSFVAKPVPRATMDSLDLRRLYDYFSEVRQNPKLPKSDNPQQWESILYNTELLTDFNGTRVPTIVAILLFGIDPYQYIKNSGISACSFDGMDKSASLKESTVLNTPMIPLLSHTREIIYPGLVELSLEFLKRHMAKSEDKSQGIRRERWDYPLSVLREAIVNALVHRDYSIRSDVELSIYTDRIEIISPGKLPNSITVERMRNGCRAARNEMLRDLMRDYKYVEGMGMGVRYTIFPEMKKHNGTCPDLIEEETRFKLVLYKGES